MMADAEQSGFTLKGWHVLVAMVMFFGIIFAVNTVFITTALNTFPGEETRRSYVQGLEYNQVIEARRAQAELGWSASANLAEERVLIEVRDADGAPVTGLRLIGELQHPANMSADRDLVLTEVRDGVYAAGAGDLPDGRWTLAARAEGETPFELETQLWRR
jgi:nitrogen fixation protein FixH